MEIESHDNDSESNASADRLVHGLLSSLVDSQTGVSQARLSRALDAIDRVNAVSEPPPSQVLWRRRSLVGSAVLSTLGVGLLFFVLVFSKVDTATAAQTVAWLRQVAAESVDRRYRFALKLRKPNRFGSSQVQGEFFVRGAEATLQRFQFSADRGVVIGRTREHIWIMGQRGPVIIRDVEPELRWGPTDDEAPQLLSVVAILERLEEGFELNFEDSQVSGTKRISAKNVRPGGEIADEVSFDYDVKSGNLLRLELRWSTEDRPVNLLLELEETLQLPLNWYEHEQHGPERRTIDRTTR